MLVDDTYGSTTKQLLDVLLPRRRQLNLLRGKWGKRGAKDGWLAGRYFELTRDRSAAKCVDDKTWNDLEFPAIFSLLDSTETPIGGQVLFKQLREYAETPDELAQRYALYETLRADAPLREAIQLRLSRLEADSKAGIANFIFGRAPETPKHGVLLSLWSLVSVATLVSVFAFALPIAYWLSIVAVNVAIVARFSGRMHRQAETLGDCYELLKTGSGLASIRAGSHSVTQLAQLAAASPERAQARRALRLLAFFRGRSLKGIADLLLQSLYYWLNMAFLTEVIAFTHTMAHFADVRPVLAATFEAVGSLDAAIALASCLERCSDHCRPAMSEGPVIAIEDGHHPLIAQPVKNSVRLTGRSALVTGSNMAGKTTFIKMVGINLILGRTAGFCFASAATMPWSSVMASIRGEHSVESGESHYFAEIAAIHSFIENAERGDCKVFVIDELLNGTNTLERLATARAVLESLCRNAQVLVTTHDVELQSVLADDYDLYHFQENPDIDGFFDYRLRPGATRERNAIRMLKRLDFPSEVVASAMRYAMAEDPDR